MVLESVVAHASGAELRSRNVHFDRQKAVPHHGCETKTKIELSWNGHVESVDPRTALTRGGLAPWQVKRVMGRINERLTENLNLNELAAVVGLSRGYFSKAFKTTFGISPYNYILVQRVELAKRRMLSEAVPLSRIALETGWADQAHLSRMFRRTVGVSPAKWRMKQTGVIASD